MVSWSKQYKSKQYIQIAWAMDFNKVFLLKWISTCKFVLKYENWNGFYLDYSNLTSTANPRELRILALFQYKVGLRCLGMINLLIFSYF